MYVHTKDVGFNDFYSVRLSVIEVVYGHISGDILYLIISVTGPSFYCKMMQSDTIWKITFQVNIAINVTQICK
jgi:hypothetical protein